MEPDGSPTNLIVLRAAKQRAEQLISTRYSEDLIDDEELERRLESLAAADTLASVDSLTVDLLDPRNPAAGVGSLVLAEATATATATALAPLDAAGSSLSPASAYHALARSEDVEPSRRRVAVLSSVQENGRWIPARHNEFVGVLNEVVIDLREALLAPGETVFEVNNTLGAVQLLLPPGLPVRVEANTFLGDVGRDESVPEHPLSPDQPVIVVRGMLLLSELSIQQRLQGEGGWGAFWRKRAERRALRRARRAQRRLPPGS